MLSIWRSDYFIDDYSLPVATNPVFGGRAIMEKPTSGYGNPTAAYLYILHLDGSALAWEYLRRNPDYRRAWLCHQRQSDTARRWGLHQLENPALDARDAHPAWLPDYNAAVQLYPDADPPLNAISFKFWHIPGRKQLLHDGKRLMLQSYWPSCCLRLALMSDLADGMAYLYAFSAGVAPYSRYRTMAAELDKCIASATVTPMAKTCTRPSPTTLLELHTLQALDATLAGASLREVAEVLFGMDAVREGWYADSGLRSRTRRLVRRGKSMSREGYRRLVQPGPPAKGRFALVEKRP